MKLQAYVAFLLCSSRSFYGRISFELWKEVVSNRENYSVRTLIVRNYYHSFLTLTLLKEDYYEQKINFLGLSRFRTGPDRLHGGGRSYLGQQQWRLTLADRGKLEP